MRDKALNYKNAVIEFNSDQTGISDRVGNQKCSILSTAEVRMEVYSFNIPMLCRNLTVDTVNKVV